MMNKDEICFSSAVKLANSIKSQEISAIEVAETIFERIEKINPHINAYCTPTFELARELAKKADLRIKNREKIPLLNGVPTSIKDLMDVKNVRTTMGFKPLQNTIAEEDEPVVARLRQAGAVLLGKTNTPAFGHIPVTDNLIFGATKNPWNLGRTSGGSSGGAGAATAAGLCALALGSDGGGSIRIPSCFCGVYGLKPSFGRSPRYEHGNISWTTLDHYGPIVRYVEDAALMLDVMKGPDDSDRFTIPSSDVNYLQKLNEKPTKLKIGYSMDLGFVKAVDPEVEKSVLEAAQKLKKVDWSVEESNIKIKKPELSFNTIVTAGLAYDLQQFLKQKENLDPTLVKMIEAGLTYSAIDVKRAEAQREEIYHEFCNSFKNFDILITPTLACPAFGLGMMYPPKIAGKGVSPVGFMSFTYPINLIGNPAASIPCGFSSEGLPIGMQIIGKRFDELTVLQVSKAFEEIAPWQSIRPKLS